MATRRKKKVALKKVPRKVPAARTQDIPWPPPDVVARFAELPPDLQTFTILLAALGRETSDYELASALREADLRRSDGAQFDLHFVRRALRDLERTGWIEEFGEGTGLDLPLINPVLEIAARNGRLTTLAKRLATRFDQQHRSRLQARPHVMEVLAAARLAYFTHDWPRLVQVDKKYNSDPDTGAPLYQLFLFLTTSPLQMLVRRLPAEMQQLALVQLGYNLSQVQSSPGDLLPALAPVAAGFPEFSFYPELLFFCGDLNALTGFQHSLAARGSSGHIQAQIEQSAGAAAFLRGDNARAITHFEAAVDARRSATGSGATFLNGYSGVIYLIALLRSGTPEHLRRAQSLARTAAANVETDMAATIEDLKVAIDDQIAPGSGAAMALPHWNDCGPAQVLVVAWVERWLHLVDLPDMNRFDRLMFDAEHAERNGYRWLAAELYTAANQFADGASAEAASKAVELFGAIHPQLRSASEAVRPREPWEDALLGIELLADELKPVQKKPAPQVEGRLAWVISLHPERTSHWQLFPVEQKMGKSGKWNKPRNIALRRLAERTPPFVTDQDRRAIGFIRKPKGWDERNELVLEQDRAILELVGHPLLFLDPELRQPVELAKRDVQLVIRPAGTGEIYIAIDPPPQGAAAVVLTRDTPSRLFVSEITPAVTKLHKLFGAEGISLPTSAKERVLKAAADLAGEIHIQSEIGGGGVAKATQVDADHHPQLHLIPHGAGLSAEILVCPIPEAGSHYSPGHGTETVFARDADGNNLQARRDLSRESEAARTALAECPTLSTERAVPDAAFRWTLTSPVDCLELLTDLHHAGADGPSVHWPKGETFKLRTEVETKQMRMALKSRQKWFEAEGEVEIDDGLVVSMREMLDLIGASDGDSGRFIQLKDGQFVALTHEFKRRLEELKAFSTPLGDDKVQINEVAAFALEELTANVQLEADKKWRDHIQRLDTANALDAEVPRSLRAELRPYQIDGFRWLARLAEWGVGGCLADDMGLGKTVQALALLLHRARGGPALVVAPTSVATNWLREAARFAPTLNTQLFGPGDRAVAVADLRAFDLVVCTFGLMQNEIDLLAAVDWHTVIIDEAQAIKNANTKRAKAAMRLQAGFRLVTTGTPIENNLGELHTLFQFINPGLLGSAQQFQRRFANPIQKAGNSHARQWLKKLVAPFILRRLKTEVLDDLPPRTEIVLSVEMSEAETAFYEALRQQALKNMAAADEAAGRPGMQIFAEITRLRRACCNPQLVTKGPAPPSSKLATFSETLDSLLEANHKVLVFSQFVDHLAILRRHLEEQQISYQYLDGSTPRNRRQQAIDAFQAGEGDVFLISLKAGGTGLNLTAADYVIHMDPWWNPASEDQASDRAHRIGQRRPVTVYRLVTKDTIEEKIVALHHEKRDLASSLLEGTDTGRTLDPEELLALIRG